ncbi:MAG: glycosyltransferase [Chloroflexi bacterium]|nr:glycosyltransferase [Chloroflexota bacterium]
MSLSVSIIIPTYNEEEDIGRTLDALAMLDHDALEVIVVDASSDRTPEIVQAYQDRITGLRLLRQGDKPGVSAARNDGLRAATGEIVVVLNADVFPEPDFIQRILLHYHNAADYVLVDSRVVNLDALFPRYIQAQHEYNLTLTRDELNWTEGFSARLAAIRAVGGFPDDFAHNTAGEDAIMGDRLQASGYRRVADYSIVVPHVMPERLRVYWRQRLGRGRGGAYVLYVHQGRAIDWLAILRSVLGTLFLTALILPALIYAARLIPYSDRGWRDWLPFAWARLLETAATAVGYWDGSREIAQQRRMTS